MRKLSHWLECLTPAESIDVYRELAWTHLEHCGPYKEALTRFLIKGDIRSICLFEVDYNMPELMAHHVEHVRQILAYFSKIEELDIGIDKDAAALKSFLDAEKLCAESNQLLKLRREGKFCFSPRVERILFYAQRKIAEVLGPVPKVEDLALRFGPGATRGIKRREASTRSKLSEALSCSENLLPAVSPLLAEMPWLLALHSSYHVFDSYEDEKARYEEIWASVPVTIVTAKLTFVAKNAKTKRAVCTEAGLNVMFQLGVGDYIASRLRRFGVDIRDQTRNQRMALEGSLTGALATLDLSSASDTISRELVYELLPLDWAVFLNYGRSPLVELPSGEFIEQSKFSSMGNGYSFPLETLIFWGLTVGACDNSDRDVSVYGDDIICPVEFFNELCETLTSVGCIPNKGKSFGSGPFRESCGKDYFRGIDVRPIYPRTWVSGRTLFVLHNHYVRRGDLERAKKVEDLIHPALKIYGPDGYGDGHLLGDHPRKKSSRILKAGFGGYLFCTYASKVPRCSELLPGDAILPLYSVYRRGSTPLHPEIEGLPEAPLELPEKQIDGVTRKLLTLPGKEGYKKIQIYTLKV